uniref:TMEM127 domain-containing protein n=1 Tax=Panagrellus redivivus TaxID=6233 RepID=A0A7E4VA30_PANRE
MQVTIAAKDDTYGFGRLLGGKLYIMWIFKFFQSGTITREEVNVPASLINIAVVILTGIAVTNDSWVKLHPKHFELRFLPLNENGTRPFESMAFSAWVMPNGRNCNKMGTFQLLQPSMFGKFYDQQGYEHTTFHSCNTVLIDCITPSIGNMFYAIISFSFLITIMALVSAILCLFSPLDGFLLWIRQNTILEFVNLMLTSLSLLASVIIQFQVANMHPDAYVHVGLGMYLIAAATLLMFASLACSMKHQSMMRQIRRIQNKKFICSRALRSWRDYGRRPEDMRPILGDEIFDEEPIIAFAQRISDDYENPYYNPVITTEHVHAAP